MKKAFATAKELGLYWIAMYKDSDPSQERLFPIKYFAETLEKEFPEGMNKEILLSELVKNHLN